MKNFLINEINRRKIDEMASGFFFFFGTLWLPGQGGKGQRDGKTRKELLSIDIIYELYEVGLAIRLEGDDKGELMSGRGSHYTCNDIINNYVV